MTSYEPTPNKPAFSTKLDKRQTISGHGCLIVFFSLFLLVGVAMTCVIVARPLWRIIQARNWQQVPCMIVSSQVKTHHDGDGDTYSILIVYDYQFNGQRHESDRYHFFTGSSSGHAGKQAIVDQYPPGKQTTCYVNPAAPEQAVLHPHLTTDVLWGLIPLIFVLVGGGGIFFTVRAWRKKRAPADDFANIPPAFRTTPSDRLVTASNRLASGSPSVGQVKLSPTTSPLVKFIVGLLVALFWNGIVSVFLFQLIANWRQGHFEWFLGLFLIPFVGVGLLMIGYVFYSALAIFNPRPELTLSSGAIVLGQTIEMAWRFSGQSSSIQRLRIFLEGQEHARYRRGTSTYTDKETFAELPLIDSASFIDIGNGRGSLSIPADTMHSWDGGNNQIVWSLRVKGEIAWWPDVDETFVIQILPPPVPHST